MTSLFADSAITSSKYLSPWGDVSWANVSTTPKRQEHEFDEEFRELLSSIKTGEAASLYSPLLSLRVSPEEQVMQVVWQTEPQLTGEFILTSPHNRVELERSFVKRIYSLLMQFHQFPEQTTIDEEQTGASTAAVDLERRPSGIEEEFRALFAVGREEYFEDGMETQFSRNLVTLVDKFGDEAIRVLDDLIVGERVNPEVASEALRWIGHIDTPSTHLGRRRLLQRSLDCSSSRIRDGAALGLAFMDDPSAIPYLEHAIEKEQIRELRQDMKQVLAQLKDTLVENAL